MSAVIAFAQAHLTSRANLAASWLAGGALRIYSAARPASPDTAITDQLLLVEVTLPDPVGAVTNGVLVAGTLDPSMIAATGTAAWCRAVDSSGVVVFDASVGITGSGEAVEIDNISLVSGALVTVTAFRYAEG